MTISKRADNINSIEKVRVACIGLQNTSCVCPANVSQITYTGPIVRRGVYM